MAQWVKGSQFGPQNKCQKLMWLCTPVTRAGARWKAETGSPGNSQGVWNGRTDRRDPASAVLPLSPSPPLSLLQPPPTMDKRNSNSNEPWAIK